MQISHARSGARILGLALAALAIAVPGAQAKGKSAHKGKQKDQRVQLLAINDLHGHLAPDTPGTIQIGCCNPVRNTSGTQTGWAPITQPTGGIEYLATHMKALQAQNPNTITVGAGDLIGASPLVSALFHDEPTIEAMNLIGMDDVGVGNHEFDEGVAELQRMQYGNQRGGDGCHPVDGCQDGSPFGGAFFKYLAANVFFTGTNRTIFPPYEVKKVGNAKIAFIGMTFEGTPTVVTPSAVEGLEFRPEVTTANALVRKLRREQGVKSFVVLLHQGGSQRVPAPVFPGPQNQPNAYMDVNKCDDFNGPEMKAIAEGLDPRIGVIVSAHTHQPYVCNFSGKLVTSAASFGRLITDIDLTIGHRSKAIESAVATNRLVSQDVPKDAQASALLKKYTDLSAPLANRIIGTISADILSARGTPNGQNAAGEQPMGDVIADAMLEATSPTDFGGAVAAFMNAGGVRSSLFHARTGVETADGQVTYGEAFTVQPFGNTLVVKTCTGQQLYDVLNQQFNNPSTGSNRIMLPSANVRYTWDNATKRVVDGTLTFGGVAVDKAASYRIAMNNFMADGGDGYTVFTQCTNALGGEVDLDAFTRYLGNHPNLAPPPLNRITRLN
ncbi:bifunctional metallophosphatase/5'-nucleotidase [Microbacterium sp.]|uniref:bifunctional metallophosphatase/5'-nucleotidase n=1 Tax=Microbacterium sp. TaxID=51671 RepID=UPI002E31DD8B|nr:bifunctional metallophosphatase/5'-nucleotidase [Microbacterium sp.]HEX5730591.1 bifunctional metallophosphatase/5'-nucleotidase [Microbacterium sp.]